MKFGIQIRPTYMPALDGSLADFYHSHVRSDRRSGKARLRSSLGDRTSFRRYGGSCRIRRLFSPRPRRRRRAFAWASRLRYCRCTIHSSWPRPTPWRMYLRRPSRFRIGKGSEPVEYRKFAMEQTKPRPASRKAPRSFARLGLIEPVNFHGEFYQLRRCRHFA